MRLRRLMICPVVVLALGLCVTGCQKSEEAGKQQEEQLLAVSVTNPVSGNIAVSTEFSGTLEYADEISVHPKLSGEVTEVCFKEGDFVNAGDLLFTLDDESIQMQLKNAQAVYDTAKVGAENQLGALQMNRDTAVNSLMTAQEGIGQTENTYGYYQQQYGDLEENRQDIEEDKDDLKHDKKKARKKLDKAKKALKEAKESGASATEIAELEKAVSTLKTSISSMESGIDGYDDALDKIDSSEDTLNYQMRNLGYSYEQAKRGAALAQENLNYFDLYTLPGTIKSTDAAMKQAQVGVDSIKLQLDYTKVTAPVSGYIKSVDVEKYDMVQAGSPVIVIADDNAVVATFNVPESASRMMKTGQLVTIDRNGNEYRAVITEIEDEVSEGTGLFEVKAVVQGSKDELTTGTSVKVTAVTNHADNVVTIPVDCVYYSGGETFTYVVENGTVRKVYLTTGIYDSENIEIIDGLTPDMQVVTVWSSDLRDGLPVKVIDNGGAAD